MAVWLSEDLEFDAKSLLVLLLLASSLLLRPRQPSFNLGTKLVMCRTEKKIEFNQ